MKEAFKREAVVFFRLVYNRQRCDIFDHQRDGR
jgi:hypothetical protein